MKFSTVTSILAFTTAIAFAAPIHNGKATYYYQNGNYGSCGVVHSVISPSFSLTSPYLSNCTQESDYIVAASSQAGTYCGQQVRIENVGGGHNSRGVGNVIAATVMDTCPDNECDGNHLDLSTGAFMALTGGQLDPPGAIGIRWNSVN
jgi:hypothetical protein